MAEKKPFARMSCEEFTQLASHKCDEPVDFRDRLRMAWHWILCVYCRRFLAQLKKIQSLLRRDREIPMPEKMRTTLRENFKKNG